MTQQDDHLRVSTATMDRLTVRFPATKIQQIDQTVEDGEFPNRSEAIRAAVRRLTHDRTQ